MSAVIRPVEGKSLHEGALGFRTEILDTFEHTKNWLDQSVTWCIPMKTGMFHVKIAESWDQISWPMNTQRSFRLITIGLEVGEAYNNLFKWATDDAAAEEKFTREGADIIASTSFVLTTEEDNIIPRDAIESLFASLYVCPDCGEEINGKSWECANGHHGYDAMSGLYMTKSIPTRPMAYGDPKKDPNDFRPQSVKRAVSEGETIEVNGIGMGCAMWRKELFSRVSEPWFATEGGTTQDLYFCRKAKKEAGARFGVNCGVKVGHMDFKTGRIY
jgi:hypothetical protein